MQPDRSLTGSNLKTAAAWNRALVLRLLRSHGLLSRRQIAAMVGLRGSTLTYIMRELLDRDMVEVVGKLESKRVGKKQVMLKINPAFGWLLGVALRPKEATLVILDAAGQLIAERKLSIRSSLESLPAQLKDGLAKWSNVTSALPGQMLALGVGVPGVVDTNAGIVLRSTLFNATRVPLRQALTDVFGLPVVIDHDACFGAGAEASDGAAKGKRHFIYFLINHEPAGDRARFNSYGSSLYLAGSIYRGAHFAAGEWGAPLLPPLAEIDAEDFPLLNDPSARPTASLLKLAQAIGRSLGAVVNLIDVQLVVIAGTARIINTAFLDAVQTAMNERLVLIADRQVNIVATSLKASAVAQGAALAAFERTLSEPRSKTPSSAADSATDLVVAKPD